MAPGRYNGRAKSLACRALLELEQDARFANKSVLEVMYVVTKELFEDILSRQIPDTEKQVRADFVIETASLEQTRADVRDLISQLTEKLSHA